MGKTKTDFRYALFAAYYMGEANFNATAAAEMAGYKASTRKSMQSIGSQILNMPEVQAMLTEKVDEVGITQKELLDELADMARWDWKENKPRLFGMEASANAKLYDTLMRAKLTAISNLIKLNTNGLKDQIERLRAAFEQHRVTHPEMPDVERIALFKPHVDADLHATLEELMKKAENRKLLAASEALIAEPMMEDV